MTARLAVAAWAGLALLSGQGAAQMRPDRATATHLVVVEEWIRAVDQHVPGLADQPLLWVHGLTPDARRSLNEGLAIFFHTLAGKGLVTSTPESKRLADLGRDTALNPGANIFLKRAAVLHADAAMAGSIVTVAPPAGRAPSPSGLVRANDGEYTGVVVADWNWPFARNLLELLSPSPTDDPFVALWYHATAAALLRVGSYGETNPHLQRAAALVPRAPWVAFDRACYFEGLTLPRARQVLDDPRTQQALGARTITANPGNRGPDVVTLAATRPTKLQDEVEAERQFRRAIALDDSLAEARVRLGRLLDSRGRHADALVELTAALARPSDPETAFHAHLFASRAARALGQGDVAAAHVRDALALFPDAQSALVAASQLALARGDAGGALLPMRHLAALDPDTRTDPWWQYPMGAGRDAERLLAEMRAAVRR